jgi:hypothetical protein
MHKARLRAREAYVAQRFEGSFWQVVWSPFVSGSKDFFWEMDIGSPETVRRSRQTAIANGR